jgi:transcriptional regulator with XRE-family HTH domain
MAFDYSKLRGKIMEKYGTQREFSKAMGFSERTLSLKLNGKIFFTQSEIKNALEKLGVDKDDVNTYFFAENVQKIEL